MPRNLELLWFGVGVLVALFLLGTQAHARGGLEALLQLGQDDPLRTLIEGQLGPVPVAMLGSHDGPLYYVIGLDPLGGTTIPLLDLPGLRYRRILYPLLSSAGGLLDGRALLIGMLAVTTLATGLASAALRSILRHFGLSPWAMVGVLANPGVWFGVRILTPDPLGLGLGLAGLALGLRRRWLPAALALAMAGFAKEPFLLFALGIAGWLWMGGDRRPAVAIATTSAAPLLLWGLVVDQLAGDGLSPTGNLAIPLAGIWHAATLEWSTVRISDLMMSGLTLLVVVGGVLLPWLTRWSFLAWQAVPWSLVAAFTSHWVWNYGNASVRAFAPLWTFSAIGIAKLAPGASNTLSARRRPTGTDRPLSGPGCSE